MTEPPAPPAPAMRPARLALVDDDRDMNTITLRLLARAGLTEGITVHDGPESFFVAVESGPMPDLVAIDYHMPGTGGLGLMARLQGMPGAGNVVAGFCSGSLDPADRDRARSIGARFFVDKPFDRARLEAICAELPEFSLVAGENGLSLMRAGPAP